MSDLGVLAAWSLPPLVLVLLLDAMIARQPWPRLRASCARLVLFLAGATSLEILARLVPSPVPLNPPAPPIPLAPLPIGASRTRFLDPSPPTGTMRIVFLGDSSTYGWGIPAERDTYPAVAGRLLQRRLGRPIEALNCGIPGATTMLGIAGVEQMAGYHPDLILLAYGHNDRRYAGVSRPGRTLPIRLDSLLRASRLFRRLRADLWGAALFPTDSRVPLTRYAANIRRMIELARASGAAVAVLILPERWPTALSDPGCLERYASAARSAAAESGAGFFDLEPAWKRMSATRLDGLFEDHVHPNVAGQRLLGSQIAEFLLPLARRRLARSRAPMAISRP